MQELLTRIMFESQELFFRSTVTSAILTRGVALLMFIIVNLSIHIALSKDLLPQKFNTEKRFDISFHFTSPSPIQSAGNGQTLVLDTCTPYGHSADRFGAFHFVMVAVTNCHLILLHL